ncbi:MAG: lamin tail domain-containing protein, partial [Flavobacteriaceae bacterium]|nr:lamin tail domain-containing protein [Flavobacteriaceae bacterium]
MKTSYLKTFWKSSMMVLLLCFGLTNGWGQTYDLVTSNAQLEEGAEYIILGQRSNNTILVMTTTQNSNNRAGVVISGTTLPTTLEAETNYAVFELGLSNGHWTFYDAEKGFLYAASSSSNYLRTRPLDSDGNSRWEINIDNDNIASVVAQGDFTRNVMQLNTSSNLFACYGGASQAPVYLYKKGVASTDPILNTSETEITGLGYMEGNASVSQSFSLSGMNLEPTSGNITVTAPANFQVSTDNVNFSNSLNIAYSGGALASTDVYVRLNESLAINTYNGNITISGGEASDATVSVEGMVTAFSEDCGEEDFSLASLTASYASNSFTGNDGVVWSYVNARNEGDYPISGNGIMFQGNTSANVSATVSNGVGTLTFQARKAFTGGSNNRQLQVYINNNLVFTTPTFGTSGTDTAIHTFTVENINATGDVAIRIQNATGNQVTLDNITWTCYSSTAPALIANPVSISDLNYIFGNGPSNVESFVLSGENLDGSEDVTLLLGDGIEVSLDNTTWTADELIISNYDGSNTTIYVHLEAGLAIGEYSDIIYIDGYGTDAEVTVSGSVTAPPPPSITVSTESIDFGTVTVGENGEAQFTVSGSNLTANVSVVGPGGDFLLSTDNNNFSGSVNLTQSGGSLVGQPVIVYVRFAPSTAGLGGGEMEISSAGATTQVIELSGNGVDPVINAPVATAATLVTSDSFIANWNAVDGAESYEIDVYYVGSGGSATDLLISEYVEGSSNNKYLEIYNGTGQIVSLSDYSIELYANGASSATSTLNLGSLQASLNNGETIVLRHNQADLNLPSGVTAYSNNTVMNYNGDDAIALKKGGDFIDIFGRIGNDPGSAWTGAGGYTTVDKTLRRKSSVTEGITVSPTGTGASAFTTLTTEWDMYDNNTVSGLGSHDFDGGTSVVYIHENLNVGDVTSLEVTGLDPETTYYYVVRAIDAVSTSENSNEMEVTTAAATLLTWYFDGDGDGYGDDSDTIEAAEQPVGYVAVGGDCDDSDATIYPGAPEICYDGKDNDCDGIIDNGCTPIVTNVQ